MRHLEELEQADGIRRVWRIAWEEVARDLPPYGERVRARIAQLGAGHPFIRTEYCLEELDGAGGLFPPQRLALLRGDHPRRFEAEPGKRYALLIDVAGEEEHGGGAVGFASEGRRDSTALTVVEVAPSLLPAITPEPAPNAGRGEGNGRKARSSGDVDWSVQAPALQEGVNRLPAYRVVDRMAWTGTRHTELHATIAQLARRVWRASAVVVDATGVGAGLASFLAATLGDRRNGRTVTVLPFLFTQASKSELGWDLLGLIDSGRLHEYADDSASGTPEGRLTAQFWEQLRATTYETLAGPGKLLRWGVPAGRGHDDLVMSLALAATLDRIDWRSREARGVASAEFRVVSDKGGGAR
jgi:hypothetical protein